MGTPELTDAVCRQLIEGVAAEAHGRDMATLVRERDAVLIPRYSAAEQARLSGVVTG